MRLAELPHTVVAYRTFGMEGAENPFMASVVRLLVVEDGGERVALAYRSPSRLPELKRSRGPRRSTGWAQPPAREPCDG